MRYFDAIHALKGGVIAVKCMALPYFLGFGRGKSNKHHPFKFDAESPSRCPF